MSTTTRPHQVIIEVSGGVATSWQRNPETRIIIVDYDNGIDIDTRAELRKLAASGFTIAREILVEHNTEEE